jgi:hypothetical protein
LIRGTPHGASVLLVMIFSRSVSAGLKNDICGLIVAYDDQANSTANGREDKLTADEHGFTQMGDGNGIAAKRRKRRKKDREWTRIDANIN